MSVAWGEKYGYRLAGQEIDITDVPNGLYDLRVIVDPVSSTAQAGRNLETKDADNQSVVRIQLAGSTVTVVDGGSTGAGTATAGPHAKQDSIASGGLIARSNLGMSDAAVRRGTGRGWDDWLSLLDAWGAQERSHPEIAAWLQSEHGVDGWWAQSVTVGYERAGGRRAVGEFPDGYGISASKTFAVPLDRLFAAFTDPELRSRWLPNAPWTITSETPGKSVRGAWDHGDGTASRIEVTFTAKGPAKAQAAVQHRRLPGPEAAATQKACWRERLADLQQLLES